MAKCECCGEIDARAAILSWSDDPKYGVPDLRGALYAYKCLDNPITPAGVSGMGKRIRARRVPKILPSTLPAGTKAFFAEQVFIANFRGLSPGILGRRVDHEQIRRPS
jgi:hypothetical protein